MKNQMLLTVLLCGITFTHAIGRHYTQKHVILHEKVKRSTQHKHLQDFEIVVPETVDEYLEHKSHVVQRRRRRSADLNEEILSVNGYDQHFQVLLRPHDSLTSDNFTIRRRKRDINTGQIVESVENGHHDQTACHYRGKMLSHRNKTTAISLCHGMTGLLRTDEHDFIIEPVSSNIDHDFSGDQQPHILYKKVDLSKENKHMHFCGRKKHHPLMMNTFEDREIRYLSDGEPVFKSLEKLSNEYDVINNNNKLIDDVTDGINRHRRSITSMSAVTGNLVTTTTRHIVETMVAADQAMVRNHERDNKDITTYILTVMNMVDGLFGDGSLASNIDIVLVEIRIIEDDDDLEINHRADKSLSNFCEWQAKAYNTTNKHDYAILLTGVDICVDKNAPCDTLGLAQIGGMCSHSDSCTINEDMGLGLAFTVAHETGHSFGMRHDGQANSCDQRGGHIMSPTLNGVNGVFTWSTCSREELENFLQSSHASCLSNEASRLDIATTSDELPGQMYGANEQCKWQFGADAKLCYYRYTDDQSAICKALWCQRIDGACETKYMPAAEGTLCGINKWCRRGACVDLGSAGPSPVNGGWSEYSAWSVCSRTCGGGVTYRERKCNHPKPEHGGHYCQGELRIYQLCNIQNCAKSSVDFRQQQCSEFDTIPYRRQYFAWVPFTKHYKYNFNKCQLLCKANGYGFFDMLSPAVKDGTRCDEKSKDVCINGKCVPVGCDNILNSNAENDACGVCNGDNSTCKFISGNFTDAIRDSGYHQVTRIPRGARSIKMFELRCCTHTYISIRSASDRNRYYLNGNWKVDFSGKIEIAGAEWTYERKVRETELLYSNGPINEDIIVEALVVRENPGISYSYAIPISYDVISPSFRSIVPAMTYSWKTELTSCSKSCAGGEQVNMITCIGETGITVNNTLCLHSTKPDSLIQACNTSPCPPQWISGNWGRCSRTCGGGIQTRFVNCKQLTSTGLKYVDSSTCNALKIHRRTQRCNRDECPPAWVTGPWSECSKTCGRGERTRSLSCKSGLRILRKGKCRGSGTKPKSRAKCLLETCRKQYQWYITAWSQCSKTCGNGTQIRKLRCSFKTKEGQYKLVSNKRCRTEPKPKVLLRKKCATALDCDQKSQKTNLKDENQLDISNRNVGAEIPAPKPSRYVSYDGSRWIAAPWQQCTKTCGGGNQVRVVKCMSHGSGSTSCPNDSKPATTRQCNVAICPIRKVPQLVECRDHHKWCYLVPQHNTCSHDYFGPQCCKSCRKAAGTT